MAQPPGRRRRPTHASHSDNCSAAPAAQRLAVKPMSNALRSPSIKPRSCRTSMASAGTFASNSCRPSEYTHTVTPWLGNYRSKSKVMAECYKDSDN